MSYYYVKSEPQLWTVGTMDHGGAWEPECDTSNKQAAAIRVRYLNGGDLTAEERELMEKECF